MRFNAHAGTFLFCCLVLLLATGLYQRVARPSLDYHLEHSSAQLPEKSSQPAPAPTSGTANAMRMPPEDAAMLGQAMKTLRDQPNNPEILITIADIFIRHKDWQNAAHFLQHAATAAPGDVRVAELAKKILAAPNAGETVQKTAGEILQKTP